MFNQLLKNQVVSKLCFHRIPASAITSHGFTVLFNFIVTTAVAYVPKMGHPVPAYLITGQARPSLPMTNTVLNGLVCQTQVSAKVIEASFGRVIAL